jgi:DNA mismatch endonuclease (patch repair protein)
MGRVRDKNTTPELAVRSLVHRLGYRYRIHSKKLPGRPDIVFAGRKKIIFIHGCFWHGHEGCPKGKLPKSNLDYWVPKVGGNKERDIEHRRKLESGGWSVLVVWQCELKNEEALKKQIISFLEA